VRLLRAGLVAILLCTLGGASSRDQGGKTLVLVEQNARKGLEFADAGYVLVAGRLVKAGPGKELLADPDMGRLFLGG